MAAPKGVPAPGGAPKAVFNAPNGLLDAGANEPPVVPPSGDVEEGAPNTPAEGLAPPPKPDPATGVPKGVPPLVGWPKAPGLVPGGAGSPALAYAS